MNILRLYRAFVEWRQDRKTVRELSMRSDRELADIGVLRSDILSAVRGHRRSLGQVLFGA